VNFHHESPECLRDVGVPAENALNDYAAAANTWNHCLSQAFSSGCTINQIKGQLHAKWRKAAHEVKSAKRALKQLA